MASQRTISLDDLPQQIQERHAEVIRLVLQGDIDEPLYVRDYLVARKRLEEKYNQWQRKVGDLATATVKLKELQDTLTREQRTLAQVNTRLLQVSQSLGSAAFSAFLSGSLGQHPLFADRQKAQENITQLQRDYDALRPKPTANVLEKTAAKAQQLAIMGKMKIEQMKFGKQEKQIGEQLISSHREEEVRCDNTLEVVANISTVRQEMSKAENTVRDAERKLSVGSSEITKQFALTGPENLRNLDTHLSKYQQAVAQQANEQADIDQALLERLLNERHLVQDGQLSKLLQAIAMLNSESDNLPNDDLLAEMLCELRREKITQQP